MYIMITGSVSMREKVVGDVNVDTELKDYRRNKQWLEKCMEDFFEWYNQMNQTENNREAKKVRSKMG